MTGDDDTQPVRPGAHDHERPAVVARRIIQFRCPNKACNQSLDITDIETGTKIDCPKCLNITWLPHYNLNWWQRPLTIVGTNFVSFLIGLAATLVGALMIGDADVPGDAPAQEEAVERQE